MTPRQARWLFRGAAIYGLILIVPMYFIEGAAAAPDPRFTHPEFYYGFVGAAAAWQLVYWVIGGDPVKYRPLMLLGTIAKFGFLDADHISLGDRAHADLDLGFGQWRPAAWGRLPVRLGEGCAPKGPYSIGTRS